MVRVSPDAQDDGGNKRQYLAVLEIYNRLHKQTNGADVSAITVQNDVLVH
jgi:hypothetical protein